MYEDMTYENIKENILSSIIGIDTREGSVINDIVSPISMEFEGAYKEIEKMLGIMFLEDSVGEYIDKRANEYGIYRKEGTCANGNVTFTGSENTIIPKGSLIGTTTNLLYETTEDAAILQGTTQVIVPIKAQDIGNRYNVLANTITQIPVAVVGISRVANADGLLGGTDIETDDELVTRILLRIRNPATSGNSMHYKLWALEVAGVGDCKVFPLWNGPGTVKVMIVDSDKKIDTTLEAGVLEYIESVRPIGALVTVASPAAKMIGLTANVVLDDSVFLETVRQAFSEKVQEYFKSITFKSNIVSYAIIGSLLLSVDGVADYSDLKLNESAGNVSLGTEEIPVLTTVSLEVV